jgi:DNA repair photolyase
MGVREVQARSILQRSGLPGTKYVINPYTGCVHGCVYCYARFMKRFTDHPEPWGTFLDAKMNGPELLRQQLARRRKPLTEQVFLSSVTDPYQKPEERYRLTRGVLEALLERQVPVSILTKSDLVLRDLDLLTQFRDCSVGLSLCTLDDVLSRRLEPRASAPSRRLAALRELHAAGVYTYAFFSPFLPGISDLDRLAEAVAGSVDEIGVEAFNTRGGNVSGLEAVLAGASRGTAAACRKELADDAYWNYLEQQSEDKARRMGLAFMGFFRHGRSSAVPRRLRRGDTGVTNPGRPTGT